MSTLVDIKPSDGVTFAIPPNMLTNASSWFLFCWVFHCLAALIVKPNWPRFASKDKHIRWAFYNRAVAIMHSSTMFMMTIHYFLNINPGYVVNVPFTSEGSAMVAMTNDFMVAYLIYDVIHEWYFTEKPDKETLLHHVLGLVTHLSARLLGSRIAGVYYMMVYVSELSTPFLHLCWGMYVMGFKEHFSFKIVCFAVLGTYFFVRVLWGPWMLHHCYTYRESWSSATDQHLYLPNLLILLIFVLLNFVWFKALLVKFVGLPPDGTQQKGDPELASTAAEKRDISSTSTSSRRKSKSGSEAAPAEDSSSSISAVVPQSKPSRRKSPARRKI
jgi:hypothetical protein